MKLNNKILTEMVKQELSEKTVRLSTMKDANFEPGQFVQLLGLKGKVKLDKKSVAFLAKWIRSNSGKHGMGWSFTEGKLTEKIKPKQKISKKEWSKIKKFNNNNLANSFSNFSRYT